MSLTWTPVESATPTWTPASDDDLTFTTRGTLSSDAITVGAETLTAYLAALGTGGGTGAIDVALIVGTAAVDGTATSFAILGWDQNATASGLAPAQYVTQATVTDSELVGYLTGVLGFASTDDVTVLVPAGTHIGAWTFTPDTIGDPWTEVAGSLVVQASSDYLGALFKGSGSPLWLKVNDAGSITYEATGLLLGITEVHPALHGVEGILDRWSFVSGMQLVGNFDLTDNTPPPMQHGDPIEYARIFLNDQTDPAENGFYVCGTVGNYTRINAPDIFDPPGNGYRTTLVAPADPAHGLTLMWLDDDRTRYFRAGAYIFPTTEGDPGEWVTVFDPTATGGGVSLGETSTTAYRGDRGKTAYDHSQVTSGNPHGTTAADVGAAATSHSHTLANISDAGTLAGLNSVASANITDGTIVAADLAASLLGRIPTTVTVASDVPSPTDGTFTNTTGLAVPVVNGTTYYILGMLDVTGINAADLRVSLTCPTGEVRLSVQGKNYASTATTADTAYSSEILASGDIVTNLAVITGRSTLVPFQGRFTATADGTLQIQHSQRTANATATTVKAGSYLTYHT